MTKMLFAALTGAVLTLSACSNDPEPMAGEPSIANTEVNTPPETDISNTLDVEPIATEDQQYAMDQSSDSGVAEGTVVNDDLLVESNYSNSN